MFAGPTPDVAEENLQARIRGNVVMTISNKFGWMVLSCGNKSEMATGYATLYGDMAGGFAVIKDVPKTLVYELCRDLNERAGRDVIPQAVLDKPPSAELRPDQKDTDSLPEYDELDPIIEGYVEGDESVAELTARGFDDELAAARRAHGRSQRVQAAAGAARCARARARRSARIAVRRSPTAGPADASLSTDPADVRGTRRPLLPELALIAATIAYGSTFVIVQHALEHVTPVGFILLRFTIGTIVLAPIALRRGFAPAGCRARPFATFVARRARVRSHRIRRLLVPERRPPAHDDVELGVHHRAVRRVHAADRDAGDPPGAGSARRHRGRRLGGRPVPAHRRVVRRSAPATR